MTNKKTTKRALVFSVLSVILCLTMLIGSTFAWFTDTISTGVNKIVSGNLDVELYYSTDLEDWKPAKDATELFDANALWEPGFTQVVYLKVKNAGNLALKYQLGTNIVENTTGVNVAGQVFDLADYLKFGIVKDVAAAYSDRVAAQNAVKGTETDFKTFYVNDILLDAGEEDELAMVVYMPTTVGNEANHNGVNVPSINFGVSVVATQETEEEDSFNNEYDANAQYPEATINGTVASTPADEFETALARANNGDTIVVDGTIALDKALTISKDITIKGGVNAKFTGTPLKIASDADVTFDGVAFENPTTQANNASAVYASNYAGTLTFKGCTFTNCKWEGIQVTPVDGANITVTGCTFKNEAGWEGHRFLHIQATKDANCTAKVTVVNNSFGAAATVTESLIDIDYIAFANITASGNTFADAVIPANYIYICATDGTKMPDLDALNLLK